MHDLDFMSHDKDVQSPADSMQEIQNAIQTALTNNSGASAPTVTYAYMYWDDTSNGVRKKRDSTNTLWTIVDTLSSVRVLSKAVNYTVLIGDFSKDIIVDTTAASRTISLPAVASVGDGFYINVLSIGTAGNEVTIDASGAEEVNGELTATLEDLQGGKLVVQGGEWRMFTMSAADGVPVGAVVAFAGAAPNATWLECNGAAVSRTTYSELNTYMAVGSYPFGNGDATSTFNLPDLKGRSPMGVGQGATTKNGGLGTNRVLAAKAGDETHTLSIAELAAHTHVLAGAGAGTAGGGHEHLYQKSIGGDGASGNEGPAHETEAAAWTTNGGAHSHTLSGSSQSAGSNAAHENQSPVLVVSYFIKAL